MKKAKRLPGLFAHLLSALTALLLTGSLLLTLGTLGVTRVLTDVGLHESIATDALVNDAQMVAIAARVDRIAREQSFSPETVMVLITPEGLRDYNRQMVRWWTGLFSPDPDLDAPQWDTQAIQDAVMEDPLFQESHSAATRRTVARDQVAYAVGQEIQEVVLPLRTQVIGLALPTLLSRIDVPAHVDFFCQLPLFFGALSAALALLLLLFMHRKLCKGWLYIGSALAASGMLTLLVLLGLLIANVPAALSAFSALLALQADLMLQALAIPAAVIAGMGVAAGFGLIGYHQRRMSRPLPGSRAA